MLNTPLYRTVAILVALSAYILIRQAIIEEPAVDAQSAQEAQDDFPTQNMANLKQFRLGSYRLEIPVPYVQQVAAELGKTNHIVLGMTYPDGSPVDSAVRNRTGLEDRVKITVYPKSICGQRESCEEYEFLQYKKRLMGEGYRLEMEIPEIPSEEDGQFKKFNITYKEEPYFMRVIGETRSPSEWYYCKDAAEKSYCSTFYRLNDNLVVELTFDADLLLQHTALRDKVNEKLGDFIYYKEG